MKKFSWPLMQNAITFFDKLKLAQFVLTSDKFTNGPKVRQFEDEWSKLIGAKHSLYVSSGSTANSLLIASLKEYYGLRDNDKVLVPACTWITSVAPIFQNNLLPIFCDVSLDDYCLDIEDLEKVKKNHPDIKMVFTTHLLGFHSNIEKIKEVFPDAIVAEDCCESHGVKDQHGNYCGSNTIGSTYSFYYGHHLATVEGGIICTNNKDLYTLMRMKRSHGLARESDPETYNKFKESYPDIIPTFLFVTDGYNFRNTELGAVLGLEQIKRLKNIVKIRNKNYFDFHNIINERPDLFHIPSCKLNQMSSFALPFVCKNKVVYKMLMDKFESHGIEFRPLVAGNLLKQPCLQKYRFSYKKVKYNADIIHELGLYVGNNHMVNNKNIQVLKKIIESIPYDQS
jgi:CDP-6-deoxy-D-xylo-4-hexulose-3-dehydrase